ncbi:unnamed protein product [Echinostoma caproni]|uniref:HORMA domain-containing protein n=1 Tax=Echinostoma caproni TaxID=27848 RepID=A0A183AXS8_9TREM|nr:unnamed protein product [Echinostoma caproni]
MIMLEQKGLQVLIYRAVFLIKRFRKLLESYVTSYYCEDGAHNLIPAWIREPGLSLEDLCFLLSGFLPPTDGADK